MKTRSGFVSNSSSSSFVVAFPCKPKTKEELRDIMFPRAMTELQPYDYAVPVEQIVDCVFGEIQQQNRTASLKSIKESLQGHGRALDCSRHWSERTLKEEDFDTKEEYWTAQHKIWDEDDKRYRKVEEEIARAFKEKHKETFIFVTVYADEDGKFYTVMEHGDIFRNLDHIRVPNH